MIQTDEVFSAHYATIGLTPAGLSLSVPAHRARSCSTRSPCYVSPTIERAARGTKTDSLAHSQNIRAA